MKYTGNFNTKDNELLKRMKYRIDFFFLNKSMETYLFETEQEMLRFIAKSYVRFESMFIFKQNTFSAYRITYDIVNCITWE